MSRVRQTKSGERRGRNDGKSEESENPLREAFLSELADIYNAEQQLTAALPKMAQAAQSEELQEALQAHLTETKEQMQRIQEAAESLEEDLEKKPCKGMKGLLEEGQEMLKEFKGKPSIDAVLIAAAQKVEHYEIASYGTLASWAEQMGHEEVARLLRENLEEEKSADEKLTEIAESLANERAAASERD